MSAVSAAGYLGSIRWISRAPSSIAFCHDAISFLFSVRLRGTGGEAERTRMTLILRAMKKHMRWEDAKDDYVVLDGKKILGASTKRYTGTPGGAGQLTRARTGATAAQWRHHNSRRGKAGIQNPVR
jgi:hypothetical protein